MGCAVLRVSCSAETGMGAFWAEAPTLQWTKARNLSLVCSPNIAACEGLLETYFMQVGPNSRQNFHLQWRCNVLSSP